MVKVIVKFDLKAHQMTHQPGISLSAASSTIDNINLTVLNVNALYGMFQSQLYYIFFVSDRTIECCQDSICLLCKENITFTVKDFASVNRKGLAAINDFSVKYN